MKFTIDVTKYRKRRKKENMAKAFHYQLQKWTGRTIKHIIRNISGPILKTRSAHLRRSITGKTFLSKMISKAIVGSGIFGRKPVKYARIHEKGGKIKAKKKFLTIPFPGVKGRAANFPDSFIIKSKKGNLLIVEKRGKSGFKPLFSLKKEVTIPARYWLSKSIKEMKPDLIRFLKPVEILKVMSKGLG